MRYSKRHGNFRCFQRKKLKKVQIIACKVSKGCYIMILLRLIRVTDDWKLIEQLKKKRKKLQIAAWKSKNRWYIKNPLRVKCAGCLIDSVEATGCEKSSKFFQRPLAKMKIDDILRTRCVLSATRLLDKLPNAVRQRKIKKFSKVSLQK